MSAGSQALAHRGLGLTLIAAADVAGGLAEVVAACAADPLSRELLIEAMTLAQDNGAPAIALDLLSGASESLAGLGRVRFLEAKALAALGEDAAAAAILTAGVEVADLREGVNSISELWLQVCPGQDVPAEYQFSMK
ncbi:hypothetical protein NHF46_02480 [Arthrobacter alpinus]|nr:hypothetical protein [Arthrobacter alpinus]